MTFLLLVQPDQRLYTEDARTVCQEILPRSGFWFRWAGIAQKPHTRTRWEQVQRLWCRRTLLLSPETAWHWQSNLASLHVSGRNRLWVQSTIQLEGSSETWPAAFIPGLRACSLMLTELSGHCSPWFSSFPITPFHSLVLLPLNVWLFVSLFFSPYPISPCHFHYLPLRTITPRL